MFFALSFLALLSLFHHFCLFSALGRESQLPLTVKGKGMGPELEFNHNGIELLDFFHRRTIILSRDKKNEPKRTLVMGEICLTRVTNAYSMLHKCRL